VRLWGPSEGVPRYRCDRVHGGRKAPSSAILKTLTVSVNRARPRLAPAAATGVVSRFLTVAMYRIAIVRGPSNRPDSY
jgi:hypothetical protein